MSMDDNISGEGTLSEVTIEETTIGTGDYIYTEKQFAHIKAGTHMKLEELREEDGDVFGHIKSCTDGTQVKYDGPALAICRGLAKGKLSFKQRDASDT